MRSILLAFAMFTRLPMPHLQWDRKNMRYIMAAFPLVGLLPGITAVLWLSLCDILKIGPFLQGTGFALLPLLITGGIHMDGFCDTIDALASHGDREKKQRILKDPHIGPFAAFTACAYLLAFAALASEINPALCPPPCLAMLFVLSRALAGLGVIAGPTAEGSSLGKSFHDAADATGAKNKSAAILLALFAASAGAIVFWGGGIGAAAVAGCLATAWAARRTALNEFGGISGDLSGWFLQLCEMVGLLFLVFGAKIAAAIAA